MWFLALGLLGLASNSSRSASSPAGTGGSCWTPFGLAVVWWAYADWSGYTKRRVIEKEEARKQTRIDRQQERLGTLNSRNRGRR